MFETLNLPPFDIVVVHESDGSVLFYDFVRKKNVAATPEEWVRLHFVNYLVNYLGFPASLIANEKGLKYNGLSRRCDTIVYSQDLRPLCIVEYKRPTVEITRDVFSQIARYNSVFKAPYLIVSNGLKHFCCRYDGEKYKFLSVIPSWAEMSDK